MRARRAQLVQATARCPDRSTRSSRAGRTQERSAPCMGSVKGGEMDQRTPLAFFLSSLLPFWRVSSFTETFLHLDATFLLTLPRRQNLLVDSVLRRGQLLVEADRDIR